MPSRTVENYLKTILHAQMTLQDGELVAMGQVASGLGVTPGTATTMVKALAEAGLVRYEPYAGVRLTTSGRKLAAMVLRRHRLIELFLVKILGMGWAEVHDEAEQLEHAVSERLIERIDAMLDRPEVDPHGDPIPGREGSVRSRDYENLLSCPLATPVIVARVTDQSPAFLRFVETSDLKPGESLEVEERSESADAVVVRKKGQRMTVGMRAASKILVEIAVALMLLMTWASGRANAQPPTPEAPGTRFEILDNSFLVEEAFNQEPGVFQNIFGVRLYQGAEWDFGFTQEWPLLSQTHQFSYTMPVSRVGGETGFGDVLINYRYQALTETNRRPAFAPRVSVILPSGREQDGLGAGGVGWQVNLPFSKQRGDFYFHWNGGFTWLPGFDGADAELTPHVAGSTIWATRPMFHLVLETIAEFENRVDALGLRNRSTALTLSPGLRGGWNIDDHQLIVGFAVPTSVTGESTGAGAFLYFSYELPFSSQ